MTDTAYFRTSGGSILLLDIPEEGTDAHSRFMLQASKGELVRVEDQDAVEAVELDGATTFRLKDDAAKPRRARAKKDEESEGSDAPEGE